jgi:UDP-2,3-diacylglucosamine pyrophosphatase LpxH
VSLKTALIIPDCHIPYHDDKAYKLMLLVARDIPLDEIVILGDFADFYAVSSHGRHPLLMHTLKTEVELVNAKLDELDLLFPRAHKVFLSGNHEYRLERYLSNMASALFGVTETKTLFHLDRRSFWKFYDYGPNQLHSVLGGKLKARHEPVASTAKLTASRAMCSIVYGHIHRIEESHSVGIEGTNHVAFSTGWLGDKTQDLIFGYVKGNHQWQLGFALVYVDPLTGYFYHQKNHILINEGKYSCLVNGKLYTL